MINLFRFLAREWTVIAGLLFLFPLVLYTTAAESAQAANWVFAGSGKSSAGTVVAEVDRASVRRDGRFAWAWIRYRVTPPTEVRPGVRIAIYEMHTRWDCEFRGGASSHSDLARAYSPSGRKLFDGPVEDPGTDYRMGTPMELAAAIACGPKP